MNIIECIHTNSSCYKLKGGSDSKHVAFNKTWGVKTYPVKPQGIVVHSTGAANTSLKRYVQPSKDDPNYNELIKTIGKNSNGNSWNRGVSKAVHYVIGKKADGTVGTAHILPNDICAWGVGKGKKGSYNYCPPYIQFEICEDRLDNEVYFRAVINEAVNLCAELCKEYGWDENVIVSHKESHTKGYGSNHGDIDHWLKKFGMTMHDFRDEVAAVISYTPPKPLAVGDTVNFIGTKQYTNSQKNALIYKKASPCNAVIKGIYPNAKHPYLLKGNGVYGYVDADTFKRL